MKEKCVVQGYSGPGNKNTGNTVQLETRDKNDLRVPGERLGKDSFPLQVNQKKPYL